MRKKIRHLEIDFLRALSILAVIFIHTSAYFLSKKNVFLIWDFCQFAVVAFVFCSSYVFFQRERLLNLKSFFAFLKKRLLRLFVPYWTFLIVMLGLITIKEPNKINFAFVLKNIFAIGGIDINWLVLLFVLFSVLFPIISFLKYKKPWFFYLYGLLALGSSVALLFYRPSFDYRLIMWLPWSVVALFSWYYVKHRKHSLFLLLTISASLLLFFSLVLILTATHHSLAQFDNKYPPNFYHLVYGIFWIVLLSFILKAKFFLFSPIKVSLSFLSRKSYSLFFIHRLVIYVLTVFYKISFTWISFFVCVLIITIIIQLILTFAGYLFSTAKRGPTI